MTKYNMFGDIRTEWLDAVASNIAWTSFGLFLVAVLIVSTGRLSVRKTVGAPQIAWNGAVALASVAVGILIVLSLPKFDNPWANLVSAPGELGANIAESWQLLRSELFGIYYTAPGITELREDPMLVSMIGAGAVLLLAVLAALGVSNARRDGRGAGFLELVKQVVASLADTVILAGGAMWATLTLAPLIGIVGAFGFFIIAILGVFAAWSVLTGGRFVIPVFWTSR